jgi:hypothetical protein
LVEQRTLNPLADSSSLSWPTIDNSSPFRATGEVDVEGGAAAVCTYVCTPIEAEEIQAAIDRLTRALATADDATIPEVVAERRALREDLAELLERGAGVVRIVDVAGARARRRQRR